MLSKKMISALNAQVSAEFYSAYMYLSMSAWLKNEGYNGSASWMAAQAKEENEHALKIYNYLLEQGAQVQLGPIAAPAAKWKSPLAVFEASYAHEQKVTALVHNLMSLAKSESDYATEIFLQWFVTEQVEEEANASEIIQKMKMVGDSVAGLFQIDSLLGQRG